MELRLVEKSEVKEIINIHEIEGCLLVSSREIANNFDKQHKHVIEKIEYTRAENSAVLHMFIESTYRALNGKINKEYLMNRDGFTLLAMGFTGKEALTWKLKYIEAFNKMEEELKNPYANMSKELQAIIMVDKKQQELEKKIIHLEDKMTVDYELAENIRCAINTRAVDILGGKEAPAYKKLNKKLFSAFHKDIRRAFKVNSYKNLSVKNYDEVIKYISNWNTDEIMRYAIQGVNSQLAFNVNN